jgi:hypothetical protein
MLEGERVARDRQLILFMTACCRRVQKWFTHSCQYEAVEVIDNFADGQVSRDELGSVRATVSRLTQELQVDMGRDTCHDDDHRGAAALHAAIAISYTAQAVELGATANLFASRLRDVHLNAMRAVQNAVLIFDPGVRLRRTPFASQIESRVQAMLLRCIFGNPFHPTTFADTWRTGTAVALAAGIYADRAFDRLTILADALEEAGCDSADVLTHCRGPGPHARGCWVVDGVLGKQ